MLVLAVVVMLGAGMALLDTTAVNVAFGSLRRDLHASLGGAQWVLTAYLLVMAMVVPVAGWAIDRFGTKRVWLFSLSVFVLGSVLSGTAWSIASLVTFRVVQAVGGGMIVPVAQTILATAAGPARLGRVMSLAGVNTVLGPVLGPVIGGALVQYANWHWVFFINLPIGAVALVAAGRVLSNTSPQLGRRLDVPGLALASVGMAGLTLGLSRASGQGSFTGWHVYLPVGAGVVFVAVFVVRSLRRGQAALLDVRMFADRHFTAASVFLFLVSTALFGALLLLPLYYQVVRGDSVFAAGLLIAPQGVGVAVAMPFAGKLTDRFGARRVVLPGLVLTLLGTLAYTQVTASTPVVELVVALVLRGLGVGGMMVPASAACYVSLPPEALPGATSAATMLRQIGGSVGTATLAAILAGNLALGPPGEAFDSGFWIICILTALVAGPAMFFAHGVPRDSGPTPPD